MFSHLVESDLHTGELKRQGTFFLATMIAYALVVMALGVVGVYAYEARIDDQQLELVALVPPDTEEAKQPEVPPRTRTNSTAAPVNTGSPRIMGGGRPTAQSNTSSDLTKIAGTAQTSTNQLPPTNFGGVDRGLPFSTGPYDPDGGRGEESRGDGSKKGGVIDEPPPLATTPKKTEAATKPRIPYIGPVTSQALVLPQPVYTNVAKAVGAEGPVNVEILIDEQGKVIAAHATSGHPLLRLESEKAAYRARFSPTLLQNQPVKAKGVITFNFILKK